MAEPMQAKTPRPQPSRATPPRRPRPIRHPAPSRVSFDDTLDLSPPQPRPQAPAAMVTEPQPSPAQVEVTEPRLPAARSRRPAAERLLRSALLLGLALNLTAFLLFGLTRQNGQLTRADALLSAMTLASALALLLLGEAWQKSGRRHRE
jgi:hypothetical protein